MDKKNIDVLFEEKLKDFGEDLPGYVWNNIEENIHRDQLRKSRRFYYGIAASIALILSFSAGYIFKNNSYEENKIIAQVNHPTLNISKAVSELPVKEAVTNPENPVKAENNNNPVNQRRNTSNNNGIFGGNKNKHILPVHRIVHEPLTDNQLVAQSVSVANSEPVSVATETAVKQGVDSCLQVKPGIINLQEFYNYTNEDLALNTTVHENSAWSLEGQFSPANSFGSMTDNTQKSAKTGSGGKESYVVNNDNNKNDDQQTDNNNSLLVLSGGLGVKYSVAKHLSLQSGVYFSKIDNQYNQVEVPLVTNYKIIDKRMSLYVSGGFSTGYMYWKDNTLRNPFNYKSIVGVGVEYDITKNLSLNFSPTFKYVLQVKKNFIDYNYPYNFGVFTGICYKL